MIGVHLLVLHMGLMQTMRVERVRRRGATRSLHAWLYGASHNSLLLWEQHVVWMLMLEQRRINTIIQTSATSELVTWRWSDELAVMIWNVIKLCNSGSLKTLVEILQKTCHRIKSANNLVAINIYLHFSACFSLSVLFKNSVKLPV